MTASGESHRVPSSNSRLPPSEVFWFIGRALAETGCEYDAAAGLFIDQAGRGAYELPDDPRMTREQAIVSLARQGVDMQALLSAIMQLEESSD